MSVVVKGKNARKPFTVRYWVDGRQKERSFATAGEARDFKVKSDHDIRAQIFTDPKAGKELFGAYAAKWVAEYVCADQTRSGLQVVLRKHLAPLHNRTLADVAKAHADVSTLLHVTIPKTAPTQVKRARTIIIAVMDQAVVQGRIPAHKLGSIEIAAPGRTRKEFTLATRKQIEALAGGMGDLALAVLIMHGTGLRIEEAMAVKITAFRESGRTLRVSEQVVRNGKATAALKHRRAGEFRDVPVPAWLWKKVEESTARPDGYLFAGRSASFPAYGTALGRFQSSAKAAGLPATFTPHSLRHGFASDLLSRGVAISELAAWLGHRDVRETVGTYGHLVPSSWTRARAALEAAWDEAA